MAKAPLVEIGWPGVIRSGLLAVNKVDLAPFVGVDLNARYAVGAIQFWPRIVRPAVGSIRYRARENPIRP
jgi:hypothetical protein